ncbi:MAG: hypothetical protein COB53_10860 [Elusimicrobia bacterium]|nr:MAG: hypothetical protein COB53_10860 [Elusimicrobiota bacterium]
MSDRVDEALSAAETQPEEAPTGGDTFGSRAWAAVSYVWFLCFLPLFFKRDDDFVLFHARQGLLLFVAWLFFAVMGVAPLLGHVMRHIGVLIVVTISLLGGYHAFQGERWTLPLLGRLTQELNDL